jgi:hypothetical protein
MKRCPACQRTYVDDSLSYCLEDGSALVGERSGSSDLAATLIIPDPRATAPVKPDTFRPTQPSPQPFTSPPPAWRPLGVSPLPAAIPARQGRGVAIASLVCAIAAFVLLGFCIIAGANGVESTLIGGVFLLSALSALVGAVMGIIATSQSSKDVSAQNAKAMSIVALVLNGFYLLITVVFLILGAANSSS